jgi:DNA polymerase-1
VENRSLILDATWLARKSYHAAPSLSNSEGNSVGGVYTYVGSIMKLLREWEPSYCIACFDSPGPLEKLKLYSEYKANRRIPDQEFIDQLPMMKDANEAFGIPNWAVLGYEGDDIIGSFVRKSREVSAKTIIHSVDRDMWQLVDDQVSILSQNGIVDEDIIFMKHGIRPDQVIDFKSLAGDSSDNVPGFLGVVTTTKLLKQWEDLEGIFSNLHNVSEKISIALRKNEEQIFKNRALVTIVCDLSVEFPESTHNIDDSKVLGFLNDMEFATLVDRFKKWRGL